MDAPEDLPTNDPTTIYPPTTSPTTTDPTTAQPTTPSPAQYQPTTAQPTTASPTAPYQPTTNQPTTNQPFAPSPAPNQPRTNQPTATEPTATEPTATEPTATEPTATEPTATEPTATDPIALSPTSYQPVDLLSRLLASTGLGIAALALLELAGTIAVGLAVTTQRLNFLHRQGYAFLTSLEKSLALALVVAAVMTALTLIRPQTDERTRRLASTALWAILVAAAVVSLGSILAVLARFRVAEIAPAQPIDSITRRVLFTFIVRNFGTAMLAVLIVVGAKFGRRRARTAVVG